LRLMIRKPDDQKQIAGKTTKRLKAAATINKYCNYI